MKDNYNSSFATFDKVRDLTDALDSVYQRINRREESWERVSIYCNSDLMEEILSIMIREYGFGVGSIHFDCSYFDDEYQSTYCLSVTDDGMIMLERAYNDSGVPYRIDGKVFIDVNDCASDIFNCAYNNHADVTAFILEELDERDNKKYEFFDYLAKDDYPIEGNSGEPIYGFCIGKKDNGNYLEFYYHSSDLMTKDTVNKILQDIKM